MAVPLLLLSSLPPLAVQGARGRAADSGEGWQLGGSASVTWAMDGRPL